MTRVADKVHRPSLVESYQENMVNFLMHTRNCTREQAKRFVASVVTANIQSPKVRSVDTISYGNTKISTSSLSDFVKAMRNKIVCPSGSVYKPVYMQKAFICTMIDDGLTERKTIVKKKLSALEIGDQLAASMHNYAQSSIKIKLNSLPGGLGSPFNLFYDKGGYNAITSTARSLIAYAYTCAEQVLGGNFAWFSEQEGINHVVVALSKAPKASVIMNLVEKFDLKIPTVLEVHTFMATAIRQYQYNHPCDKLLNLLNNIPQHTLIFLYYMSNLRHLIWENDQFFRNFSRDLLSYDSNISTDGIDPADMWKIDEDLRCVIFTVMADVIQDIKLSDLLAKHPDVAKLIAANGKVMQAKLDSVEELFAAFIYHDLLTPNILTRKAMFRNTVIISDTDSVIYTSKAWVDWYVGNTNKIVDDSYNIAALSTYWLTKAVADTLAKFSIAQGATGANIPVMQMKNEFLYPALLLYDIKKVYAAIIKVVEGVVLPKPKPDLKGQSIRGSSVSKEARDFCEDLIINHILKPSMDGKLSAAALLRRCVDFEHHIRNSIENGETTFLQNQSVKMAHEYANADGSAWGYMEVWNKVFGDKLGVITPPDKVPIMKLIQPTMEYYENLLVTNKEVHDALCAYVADKGKFPTAILISPTARKIPAEIIPLCDIRSIIYKNMKPVYLTLERLNITQGFSNKDLLLCDVYC